MVFHFLTTVHIEDVVLVNAQEVRKDDPIVAVEIDRFAVCEAATVQGLAQQHQRLRTSGYVYPNDTCRHFAPLTLLYVDVIGACGSTDVVER